MAGRTAGCVSYTESLAQVEAEMEPEYARSIVDNLNTWIYMLVNHLETAQAYRGRESLASSVRTGDAGGRERGDPDDGGTVDSGGLGAVAAEAPVSLLVLRKDMEGAAMAPAWLEVR